MSKFSEIVRKQNQDSHPGSSLILEAQLLTSAVIKSKLLLKVYTQSTPDWSILTSRKQRNLRVGGTGDLDSSLEFQIKELYIFVFIVPDSISGTQTFSLQ